VIAQALEFHFIKRRCDRSGCQVPGSPSDRIRDIGGDHAKLAELGGEGRCRPGAEVNGQDRGVEWCESLRQEGADRSGKDVATASGSQGERFLTGNVCGLAIGCQGPCGLQDDDLIELRRR
jgi:hypothetical protein